MIGATRRLLLAAALGPVGLARAQDLAAYVPQGALRPGQPTEVRFVRSDGVVPPLPPEAAAFRGGTARPLDVDAGRWLVVPAPDAAQVEATAWIGGAVLAAVLPVEAWPEPALPLPTSAVTAARRGRTVLRLPSDDPPVPEALQVVTGEGRVLGVRREAGGIVVEIEADDRPEARAFLVGIRDGRSDAPPAWTRVRLRATGDTSLSAPPGTAVTAEVGGRTYGPVIADEDGRVTVTFQQDPGDDRVMLRLVDPYGNVQQVPVALPRTPRAQLLALVEGPRFPGEAPPGVWLRGVDAAGAPWRRSLPTCRTPVEGDLPVMQVSPGMWRVAMPALVGGRGGDLRVRCRLGEEAEVDVLVPLADAVPTALDVDVFPEILSADFPVADVLVSLRNAEGVPIPAEGRVRVEADLGRVDPVRLDGNRWETIYRGEIVGEIGEDDLRVQWFPDEGRRPVDRLEVSVGAVPAAGPVTVQVRALDRRRRPVAGETVEVVAGGARTTAVTGGEGWTRVTLPLTDELAATLVEVRSEHRRASTRIRRGAGRPAPGDAVFSERIVLRVDPGRVAEVDLRAVPSVVTDGRDPTEVELRFFDRTGTPVEEADPEIAASVGRLVEEAGGPVGVRRWRWIPPGYLRRHEAVIRARSDVLDVEDTVRVVARPREIRGVLGLGGGLQTNLGAQLGPRLDLYTAWVVPLRSSGAAPVDDPDPASRTRLMIRGGVAAWPVVGRIATGFGVEGRVGGWVVPVHVGLSVRHAWPAHGLWAGVAGQLAPYWGEVRFDDVVVQRGVGVLPPGLQATFGYGVRVPGGELGLELSASTLSNPSVEVLPRGYVGGLGGALVYRVGF